MIIAGVDPSDGGPAYSVPRLAQALAGCEVQQTLLSVGIAPPPVHSQHSLHPTAGRYFRHDWAAVPVLRGLRRSAALRTAAFDHARSADLIHTHGLWLMPNIYAGKAAQHAGKPLIVSPRGMLAPAALAFSRHKKALFWRMLQGPAYARAALWHATSAEEADDIRRFGIAAPIALIANGIDLPEQPAPHSDVRKDRTILFLSRLHPKKNLPGLIDAWHRIAADRPDWRLVIAGPDEGGHRAQLEAQAAQLGAARIAFTGPVYGPDKAALIARADLFVLPTQSENFGIAVAELLAAGVPTIVTKGAPWEGLDKHRAGWWIDHGTGPLVSALQAATALPPAERRAMGLRGRAWMARDFGWDRIAGEMAAAYRWVLGQGDRPGCVMTN